MMPTATEAKWIKDVLAFDPFSGDQGDPGDRELSDQVVKCRKGGICHGCTQRFRIGDTIRRIVKVYAVDGLMAFAFCRLCCDAQAASWTDGGAALTGRNLARGDD